MGVTAKDDEYSVTGKLEIEFVTPAVLMVAVAEQDERRKTNAVKLQAFPKEDFSQEFVQ